MSLVVNDAEKRITNPYGGGHNGVDIGWRSNEAENEVWANCAGEVVEVPNVDKSIDELARGVLEGKYGNGKVRKDALGDKYDEVQKRVNQILNGETNEVIYEVQSGDTLSSIARKFNKVWKDIYNDNRAVIGSNPNLIFRGQKLVIR